MVIGGHNPNDCNGPNHVHLQGDSVQPTRLQFPASGIVCGRSAVDIRSAAYAEEQARPAQPYRHGLPRAALDVFVAAAIYHVL